MEHENVHFKGLPIFVDVQGKKIFQDNHHYTKINSWFIEEGGPHFHRNSCHMVTSLTHTVVSKIKIPHSLPNSGKFCFLIFILVL